MAQRRSPLLRGLLLCILHKNRPIMVPIAGFSTKSTPFNIYLQIVYISSFFQIFPKPCAPDRVNGAAQYAPIALASAVRPADDRERPSFRPVPPYANFLLLLAVGYMRLIFPETGLPGRHPICKFILLKVIGILSLDFFNVYPEVKHCS